MFPLCPSYEWKKKFNLSVVYNSYTYFSQSEWKQSDDSIYFSHLSAFVCLYVFGRILKLKPVHTIGIFYYKKCQNNVLVCNYTNTQRIKIEWQSKVTDNNHYTLTHSHSAWNYWLSADSKTIYMYSLFVRWIQNTTSTKFHFYSFSKPMRIPYETLEVDDKFCFPHWNVYSVNYKLICKSQL